MQDLEVSNPTTPPPEIGWSTCVNLWWGWGGRMRVFFPPRAKKREATDFECHFFSKPARNWCRFKRSAVPLNGVRLPDARDRRRWVEWGRGEAGGVTWPGPALLKETCTDSPQCGIKLILWRNFFIPNTSPFNIQQTSKRFLNFNFFIWDNETSNCINFYSLLGVVGPIGSLLF